MGWGGGGEVRGVRTIKGGPNRPPQHPEGSLSQRATASCTRIFSADRRIHRRCAEGRSSHAGD